MPKDDTAHDQHDLSASKGLYEELESRCEKAKIKIETNYLQSINDVFIYIHLPNGRDKRKVTISRRRQLADFLRMPFESITVLGNYIAYHNRSDNTIEAALRPLAIGAPSLNQTLLGASPPYTSPEVRREPKQIDLLSDKTDQSITIGHPSSILALFIRPAVYIKKTVCIKLNGIKSDRHDHALSKLDAISNSLLFDIDITMGVSAGLARVRAIGQTTKQSRHNLRDDLRFPQHEYDQQATALYSYANSALGMPLLQYLAFYQSIEFYFLTYSQVEAQRRIRNILKDPGFQVNRDADVGKILSIAKSAGGRGFGDERTQLRNTLMECLDPDDLRNFMQSVESRKNFFSIKSKALDLNALSIDRENVDLRTEVAERIYKIRCMIVHTKGGGDGEVDMLLPYSKEAESLDFDIDLIKYVSQRVLIAASRPMQW